MRIEKVAVFANESKIKGTHVLDEMREYLSDKGIDVSVVLLSGTKDDYCKRPPVCDLAISLGGDGTVLTTAVILKQMCVPVMAVNLGTFGYITEISLSEYQEVFDSILKGSANISSRVMLSMMVVRDNRVVYSSTALNDATVTAYSRAKLAKLNLYINGTLAANLKSDGLIIATPTGSTAYSLAAGGPILEAGLKSLIVNPICPFSMSVRPLVVSDESKIKIEIPKQKTLLMLTSDGHDVFELREGDVLYFEKSPKEVPFVRSCKRNFIETLSKKLGWAGGFNA